jgi:hypothetical protein
VAGFNVTRAPPLVTATMAGGVAATALADDGADADAFCVIVTVGAGLALPPPQADSRHAMTAAPSSRDASGRTRWPARELSVAAAGRLVVADIRFSERYWRRYRLEMTRPAGSQQEIR